MTRRQLARNLSTDIGRRGLHYHNGTTIFRTDQGEWGAFSGLEKPPNEALFFEYIGWDQHPERNTVLKVELTLRNLERKYTGTAEKVHRRSLR